MASRQGFADARRSMTQTDIAILSAGIAKLGEAAVLAGDQKGPALFIGYRLRADRVLGLLLLGRRVPMASRR